MHNSAQLRTNIITSIGSTVASALVMGIAYPLYLHFLGYQQYGLWLVLCTVLTMAQVGNFGISPALVKLIAEDYAAGDIDGVYKYIACAIFSLLVSGFVLTGAVLLLRGPIITLFALQGPTADLANRMLPYIGALSSCALLADAISSIVAGLGRYDLVSYIQLAAQVLTVVISLILFELHRGIWALLIANAAGALFLIAVSLALARSITGSRSWVRFTWDRRRLGRILNFGSWVFGASLVNVAINPVNKLFITRFAGIAAVPVYDLSIITAMKIRSLFESGFRSLTPQFSSLNALSPRQAQASLKSADRKGAQVVLLVGTLVFLTVFLNCDWALKLWLGSRFTPLLPPVFRIILIGTYFSLWGVQPWYSLLGFGQSWQLLLANLAMALANISFVLLSPEANLQTVAVGTSLGMLVSTLYLRWQGARLAGYSFFRPAFDPIQHPVVPIAAQTSTNQSPQRV